MRVPPACDNNLVNLLSLARRSPKKHPTHTGNPWNCAICGSWLGSACNTAVPKELVSPLRLAQRNAERPESESTGLALPARTAPAGPRVLVGAILMALAAAGTFATANGAFGDSSRPVVVASRDLAPGTRLEPGDLSVRQMTLDSSTQRQVASSPSQLTGLTLLGPVDGNEVIQAGNVIEITGAKGAPQISFALPAARAVGGSLRSGEVVDVLTSDNDSGDGTARVAVAGADVVTITGADSGMGASDETVVTLAVSDTAKAAAIASAVDSGSVTLVRTTSAPR